MTEEKAIQVEETRALKKTIISKLSMFPVFTGLVFFLTAGGIDYWPAWVYMGVLVIPSGFVLFYLLRHDPELLKRRMRLSEREKEQKRLQTWGFPVYFASLILPGFDWRFGWSNVPVFVILAANLVVLLAYLFFFYVLRVNSYASRVVEVAEEQKVITTGPYAHVRHPMYVAIGLLYLLSPLALASYWALPAAALIPVILVFRIRNEEEVLVRDLPGYEEYRKKVRYRLIPGIW